MKAQKRFFNEKLEESKIIIQNNIRQNNKVIIKNCYQKYIIIILFQNYKK